MPQYVTVPRIDPVKWRDLLRSVWAAEPGLVTAKLTFNTLYSQFQEMKKLRGDIDKSLAPSLARWDQELENYQGRLAVYRGVVFDSAEQAEDPVLELTERYASPVFEANYSSILGDPDATVEWPGFRTPKPLVADAMTSAMLYNQLLEVVFLSDQQAAVKIPFLASCITVIGTSVTVAPVIALAVSPPCLAGIGMHFSGHLVKAKQAAVDLGADISKKVDDAVKAVEEAAAGLVNTVTRVFNAASEGLSFGVKAVGVVLGAAFLYFVYQKATEDSHG